jgi:hypothetical protein
VPGREAARRRRFRGARVAPHTIRVDGPPRAEPEQAGARRGPSGHPVPPRSGLHTSPVPRPVADLVFEPRHAGALADAPRVGEATGGERLVVRLGLWTGPGGGVVRARWRASTCASLIAYAEAACALLEAGRPPDTVSAADLRAEVSGVHPGHLDRAELVLAALRAASAAGSGTPSHPAEGSRP